MNGWHGVAFLRRLFRSRGNRRIASSSVAVALALSCYSCSPVKSISPAAFSDSDQRGTTQDVAWTFSARKELDQACLQFQVALPATLSQDPDAQRLSSSRQCVPAKTAGRGEMVVLTWTEIPGAGITYGYGLALLNNSEIRAMFEGGRTATFPVVNGAFVVVYRTDDTIKKLQLRSGSRTLQECDPYSDSDKAC